MGFIPQWTWDDNKRFELALAQFPPSLPYFLENIAHFLQKPIGEVNYYYQALAADIELIESDKFALPEYVLPTELTQTKKRAGKGIAWSPEEHMSFLQGLEIYGRGDWRNISRNCVKTRTATQVASHAQKFYIRQDTNTNKGERTSIHDDVTVPAASNDVTPENVTVPATSNDATPENVTVPAASNDTAPENVTVPAASNDATPGETQQNIPASNSTFMGQLLSSFYQSPPDQYYHHANFRFGDDHDDGLLDELFKAWD